MKKCNWHTVRGVLLILLLLGAALVVLNFNKLQGQMAYTVSSNRTKLHQARRNKQKKKPDYNLKHVKPISPQSLIDAWRHRQGYRAVD